MTDSSGRATFGVGHWTDSLAGTGCTVVLFDRLVPTVVDVRGGAPGTRKQTFCRPTVLLVRPTQFS